MGNALKYSLYGAGLVVSNVITWYTTKTMVTKAHEKDGAEKKKD